MFLTRVHLHQCLYVLTLLCEHASDCSLCHTYFNSLWTWSDIWVEGSLLSGWSFVWRENGVAKPLEWASCFSSSAVSRQAFKVGLAHGTTVVTCKLQYFLSANFGGIENSLKVLVKFRPFWIYMKQLSWGIDGSRCSFLHSQMWEGADIALPWWCWVSNHTLVCRVWAARPFVMC